MVYACTCDMKSMVTTTMQISNDVPPKWGQTFHLRIRKLGQQANEGSRRSHRPASDASGIFSMYRAVWSPDEFPNEVHRSLEVVCASLALKTSARVEEAEENNLGGVQNHIRRICRATASPRRP